MIHLFEQFDIRTKTLYESLTAENMDDLTIVIHDDGFLPDAVTSPYRFFAENEITPSNKGLFFNEVEVPPFWSIEGNNNEAWIKDMGEIRGHILYQKDAGYRIVQSVEWLDPAGHVRFVDHYDRFGIRYAQTTFDLQGTAILKVFFNRLGEQILYHNFITQDIILTWNGKDYLFDEKAEFILFYLKVMQINDEQFLINHLGTPLTVLYRLNQSGHDYVVWQEHIQPNTLPGNMELLLNRDARNQSKRDFTLIIPNTKEYDLVTENISQQEQAKVKQGGYIYPFTKQPHYQPEVLIMTNSDQIEHLASIVTSSPHIKFHIGAVTEMSQRLMNMEQYENVKLYPAATNETIDLLYQKCDIYLDINSGNEITNAVKRAFMANMLIFAYQETIHQRSYICDALIYPTEDYQALIHQLHQVIDNTKQWQQLLNQQHQHADAISTKDFQALFKE